ncbi:zinc finger MYM-type protein 1-like [Dioscorea cayenensis subsp. rotundata]|uniref:Zinc finger MYM-type protein 1-like n=1 Tax=Dioscorea cayennensis subsp. rotundata TaxID=55577 RepID=A0AB40AM49_DIOCR|nr:zinc finger MYM-type protein 1-like [Dioscorea cayenensis subsp. rotundata]
MEVEYHTRLTTILDVTQFLLKQGLAFCGHDESSSSLNKSNFLELLEWYSLRNDKVFRAVNQNAPGNNQMTSLKIQKELANASAVEITCAIVDDIREKHFSLMIDEARDVSVMLQMGVVLRYVDKNGYVIERFLAMVHVLDTSTISLKNAIDCLFSKHGLSLSRLRGQGYDGASNMLGYINGLKALVLKENPYIRYIHYFAHRLQLVIVVVDKDNGIVSDFFQYVIMIVNTVGASRKRKDQLRQHHYDRLVEQLERVEIVSGRGKHQESSLARPGDTHWESHYTTIPQLISMWTSVLDVLQNVHDDGASNDHRSIAVIDLISQEMQNRFTETSTELLLLLSCLDPKDSFSKFNIYKLLHLAELYFEDFTMTERMMLEDQVATFIYDVRHDADFINVRNLRGFARKMVETGKHIIFPLIYHLIELALALPVVTASDERVFSAMNIVKTDLRNKMVNQWMNDSLVVYIEREVFATIDNEAILQRFQKMQTQRMQLSPLSLSHMAHISSINAGIGSSSSESCSTRQAQVPSSFHGKLGLSMNVLSPCIMLLAQLPIFTKVSRKARLKNAYLGLSKDGLARVLRSNFRQSLEVKTKHHHTFWEDQDSVGGTFEKWS